MLKLKNITITICTVILLLSITVSAITLSNSNTTNSQTNIEEESSSLYSYYADAKKEREFDVSNLSSATISNVLTYRGTATEDKDSPLDVYCDTYKNEYLFDSSNKILGFIKASKFNNTVGVYPEFKQSKDFTGDKSSKAAEIAADFAGKLYGISFAEYKLTSSKERNGSYYDVVFDIPLGEDGLFSRNKCTVRVDNKGNILYCVKTLQSISDDFDTKLLEGVNENMLTEYALKEATAILGETTTINVKKIKLVETDDGYAVRTEVFFKLESNISEDILNNYEINFYNSLYTYSINIYYPLS